MPVKSGSSHWNWNGGISQRKSGYIKVLIKKSDYRYKKVKTRYAPQHVIMMENKIGRMLTKDEIVHHKNEIRNDNRMCNLQLMTNSEHTIHHLTGKKRSDQTKKRISESSVGIHQKEKHIKWRHDIDKGLLILLIEANFKIGVIAKKCLMSKNTVRSRMKYYEIYDYYNQLHPFNH